MAPKRRFAIAALLVYTLIITILRTIRAPNDFAEAQWLLDYRYGLVKRGLPGEILSLTTNLFSIPITATVISIAAGVAFIVFCVALLGAAGRIVHRSGWSFGATLAMLVFFSSPFMVMSAHLFGYYDNIVVALGIAAIFLLFRGKPWGGAVLLAVAILIHESSLLLALAPFCLAWFLENQNRRRSGAATLSFFPLLLPISVFVVLAVGQNLWVSQDFVESYAAHLSRYPFIQEGRNTLVPQWISTSFVDYYFTESGQFWERLGSLVMLVLVLPTTLTILSFTKSATRLRFFYIGFLEVLGVSFAPLLMHLVAWDTTRIWTYTILCAFLVLWVRSEIFPLQKASLTVRLLCMLMLAANAVIIFPLMDGQVDHFTLKTRLLLYAPAFLGSLILGVSDLPLRHIKLKLP